MSQDPIPKSGIAPFETTLAQQGLTLTRGKTSVLQINVGLKCDLACRHCHLEAGPARSEAMTRATMAEVIAFASRGSFQVADITGGAPELVPDLPFLLAGLAPAVPTVMLRTNLTALSTAERLPLLELCRRLRIVIVASFPALTPAQIEAQRGSGVWDTSVAMLQKLNAMGFGRPGSGLELHLVANPGGAFLPQNQAAAEREYHRTLARKLDIEFNRLFVFANMPLGRFKRWLATSGNLDSYMDNLLRAFNPCTIESLMCRSLVSVAWDGTLYDCDFNQAANLPLGGRRIHVSDPAAQPAAESPIATGEHCYACSAGSGFT
ncbi:MAG: radical SAM protein [Desulfuromonadales bacterium GWD2_61_12]|nr:MAG: radical SAM protein [Desulfuromonadales bacterium GWC2_61_20]OGR33213.1 MAG: radical SAM protein [Desulfuromonadales bacterium GWD2_61_12]HBT82013.1 DUF3641 domain-containing protein [Desulfuromonas sp.]